MAFKYDGNISKTLLSATASNSDETPAEFIGKATDARHHHSHTNTSILGNVFFVAIQLLFYLEIGDASAPVPYRKLGGISLECGGVFLTVSSLWRTPSNGRGIRDSELEMNWEMACDETPEWGVPNWVGLFAKDPTLNVNQTPIIRIEIKDHPWGFFKTNVTYSKQYFPNGWSKGTAITTGDDVDDYVPPNVSDVSTGPHCMPHWIASFKDNTLIKANCLKIQPTWMQDHRSQLGWLPLKSLFIPGTHNSGCFYKGSQLNRRDTFQRYILTQDRDIWSQLVHGIRYLDFRVGYYSSSSSSTNDSTNNSADSSIYSSYKLWINHDLVRVTPLLPLIRDIRRFLEISKEEIVILDFHRFPVGFQGRPQRHQILLDMIQKELGHLIIPPIKSGPLGPKLNDIWATGQQLIICYGDNDIVQENSWLWSPLHQFWGNQQTPMGLKTYLQNVMINPPRNEKNPMWAAMAQLTPTTIDVMFKPSGSLRHMADSINRNLTTWVRTKWWRLANIVATDFFLGNNIIDLAINSNVYKVKFP
ncbi:PI-PLC X domain-containing protein 1 isoform X2 [Chrysoperla carnea]|uniref:PI-PLC X domain-containing protein 1 isoform X2 n=1 Tax=Chrysoperla carnea TaxID=189513 RepID=UPI001D09047D|nr:PI-PLC X domain-containing protein 1 isoform X2 [Chrysoperla carnea]